MVFIEAVSRYVKGVVKEFDSVKDESYSPDLELSNIEYPQYTRPQEVY
jgi:tRNA G37 N-methylase TrmD